MLYVPSSTSTNTGTRPFWMIGLTVVGKPAATVITSSPGCSRRSPSFGDVSAVRPAGSRTSPELHEERVADAEPSRELALELRGEAAGGQPEVERGVDEVDESSASKTRPEREPATRRAGSDEREDSARVVLAD